MSTTARENIAIAGIVIGVFVWWIGALAVSVILAAAAGIGIAALCLKDSDW